MIRKFICGCDIPTSEALQGDRELKTLVTCRFDAEGFLMCSVHGQRRYGWASLPIVDTLAGRRADFRFAGMTALTVERIVLFEEVPSSFEIPFIDVRRPAEDWRDNRDPEIAGANHMAHRYGASKVENGRFVGVVGMGESINGRNKWLADVPIRDPEKGRALLEYHREFALRTEARRVVSGKVTGSAIPR